MEKPEHAITQPSEETHESFPEAIPEDVAKAREQELQKIFAGYNDAIEHYYQKEQATKEKDEQAAVTLGDLVRKALVEDTESGGRKLDSETSTHFAVPVQVADKGNKNERSFSALKKFGVAAAAFIGGMFPSKEAKATQLHVSDKPQFQHERSVTAAPEQYHELTEQEKTDWGEYVTYVKGRSLDKDPRMNHREFANKVLHEFLAQHQGPTTLNEAQVGRIQQEFQKLREWIVLKVKNHEKINGHYVEFAEGVDDKNFMANLSKVDQIAGPQTLRYFGADYAQMKKEELAHLNNIAGEGKGLDATYVAAAKEFPPVAEQFVSMRSQGEK